MDYAIKIENLTKQFMGLKALDDLSLEFPSGQTTRSDWPQRFGQNDVDERSHRYAGTGKRNDRN